VGERAIEQGGGLGEQLIIGAVVVDDPPHLLIESVEQRLHKLLVITTPPQLRATATALGGSAVAVMDAITAIACDGARHVRERVEGAHFDLTLGAVRIA
jgi:hypothetical protein